MSNLHEEGGVFGVYSPKPGPVADLAYYGLYALQHRGQESSGIVVNDDGVFTSRKDMGVVNEVFSRDDLMKFPQGTMAVAHARYGTTDISERHRHRYEFNNDYRGTLTAAGPTLSGLSPDGRLVETVELTDRPFFVGVQYHPEFKSRPNRAHPLFCGFIGAAIERKYGK